MAAKTRQRVSHVTGAIIQGLHTILFIVYRNDAFSVFLMHLEVI